ncbi:MAG: helix-turn-helix domain-containing protein [Nitrospira sp.]|nr:MAG: helix-turn-helix domain-containing protein [Nitrospira sp.]
MRPYKPSPVALPPVLVVAELMTVFRISKGTAHRWLRLGKIPSIKIGRRRLIQRATVAKLLALPPDPPEAA